jgi:HlyD family secretion protein
MRALPVIDVATEPVDEGPKLRGTVMTGLIVVSAFVAMSAGWSLWARLDSAVVAQGVVIADSHRKTVQHLEGGILRELLVKEGDPVRAGQPVALLDATQSDAQLGQLVGQFNAVQARISRLRAEQSGSRALALPPISSSRRARTAPPRTRWSRRPVCSRRGGAPRTALPP